MIGSEQTQFWILREETTIDQRCPGGSESHPSMLMSKLLIEGHMQKAFLWLSRKVSRKDFISLIHGGEYISRFHSNLAIPAEANRWTPQAQPKDSLRVSCLHDSATEVSMTKFIDDFISFSKHIFQDLTIKASKGKSSHKQAELPRKRVMLSGNPIKNEYEETTVSKPCPYQSSGLERRKDR